MDKVLCPSQINKKRISLHNKGIVYTSNTIDLSVPDIERASILLYNKKKY